MQDSATTWENHVPELLLSQYRIGICYLAGPGWQICFEEITCFFLFGFLNISSLLPWSSELHLLGDYLHRSSNPGVNFPLKFLVRTKKARSNPKEIKKKKKSWANLIQTGAHMHGADMDREGVRLEGARGGEAELNTSRLFGPCHIITVGK